LPVILSPEEVVQFLGCAGGRKHHAILTSRYAAGQRISEAVRLIVPPWRSRLAFAVHLLEPGTEVSTIQPLLGHRSHATTARYLRITTSKVCSASSPLDLLPRRPTLVNSNAVSNAASVVRLAFIRHLPVPS
jgi:site-specific recombinase XerD